MSNAKSSKPFKLAFELLDNAVSRGAFPGGVITVSLDGRLMVHPFGRLTFERNSKKVKEDTIYDLASLTKPIVTTTSIMLLAQQGILSLDEPIASYIPEWIMNYKSAQNMKWRKKVTVKMLLLHSSGLPAHRHFYKFTKGHNQIIKLVINEPLAYEPNKKIEYSDLNFILLGEMTRRLTGRPLDDFANVNIFKPLMMKDSIFNPPDELIKRIAPTEVDNRYRKRLIRGEVHDENAWAMEGVSGHAGLFSTAKDISIFAQMLLDGGRFSGTEILDNKIIRKFTKRQNIAGSSRALGWDVPTSNSSSGHYFSKSSFGHTGFTGTSLWIDPKKRLFVILLTNRVNPTRKNELIRKIRPQLHDLVVESLGLEKRHSYNSIRSDN